MIKCNACGLGYELIPGAEERLLASLEMSNTTDSAAEDTDRDMEKSLEQEIAAQRQLAKKKRKEEIFCSECGQKKFPGGNFCTNCGTLLVKD